MKSLLKVLIIAAMLLGVYGCSNNGGQGGKDNPAEPEIKGETVNMGRFSVLVPEGWCSIDMSEYSDGFNAVLLKGTQDDWMQVPQVSIIYCLPTEIIVSAAAFYDNVIQQPSFELGDYHWTNWTGTNQGLKSHVRETEGDFGFISVALQQVEEGGDMPSMDDKEVQAIIKSIKVQPTTEVSWVKISNGKATAELTPVDGYMWEENAYAYAEGVDIPLELEGNTARFDTGTGNGLFRADYRLINEEGTLQMGEASIAFKVVNGKIDGLYDATMKIYDEPEDIEGYDDTDDTDYEYIDSLLVGVWTDEPNGLTMFIQNYPDIEHAYVITIQSAERTIVATGLVQYGGTLWYESVSFNGTDSIESDGWFMFDSENVLIWGHDEVVGEYSNVNIFYKAE